MKVFLVPPAHTSLFGPPEPRKLLQKSTLVEIYIRIYDTV